MPFKKLNLIDPLLRAIDAEGYTQPTSIQQKAIPHVLGGRDLLGCAQTGTGKTAAFALPILQRLHETRIILESPKSKRRSRKPKRVIRTLILTPTRELAAQIGDNFRSYSRHVDLSHTVIFGGVKQYGQVRDLQRGTDILVATPGRLLDLVNQQLLDLSFVEIFVLDEADRMLDMGFIHDIRKVIGLIPEDRQTLLFSATMPKEIRALADTLLDSPVTVKTTPKTSAAADTIQQSVYHVDTYTKSALLINLIQTPEVERSLVFTRTKRGADRVTQRLERFGIPAEAIHSNKSQNARQRALDNFKNGRTHVLVASDIASRGIDVENITHVFNYDLPNEPETYIHRIGRTGRAGLRGQAVSFCCEDQRGWLKDIEKLLGKSIPVLEHNVQPLESPPSEPGRSPKRRAERKPRRENARPRRKSAQGRNQDGPRENRQANRSENRAENRPGERKNSKKKSFRPKRKSAGAANAKRKGFRPAKGKSSRNGRGGNGNAR